MAPGPECCTTPAPFAEHCCAGKEETFGPFLTYVSAHHTPTAAVVLIHDIFGYEVPLLRKLADKIACAGYFVVLPDFYHKDPFVPADPANPLASIGSWIKKHHPLDSIEGAKQVVECLHEKGFSSVGAIGFCWGAKVVVELAKGDWLKVAILAHPYLVSGEDIRDVKTPIAILAAEFDTVTPPALAQEYIDILKSKPEVESFAHIYRGVPHGWTIKYNVNDPKEVSDAEESHNKMLEWCGKFLHR